MSVPPRRAPWHLLGRDQIVVYALGAVLLGAVAVRTVGSRWAAPSRFRALEGQDPIRYEIDLNRADATELDLLPGIGPALAERIVEYRDRKGPFRQIEDLMKVQGIGKVRIEKLRGLVKVGVPTSAGAPTR